MSRTGLTVGIAAVAALLGGAWWWQSTVVAPWTDAELTLIASLNIDKLPSLPADPSNAVADSPDAARLGYLLFFDKRLSSDGTIACASCHQPERRFTDGLQTAQALGPSARNTMSLVGSAYSPWFYWDGRKDSQWAQALSPLEDPVEHGTNRMRLARLLTEDAHYRELYATLFGSVPDFSDTMRFPADAGPLPDAQWQRAWDNMQEADRLLVNTMFANLGKALAAYERHLQPGPARFDAYADALRDRDFATASRSFTEDEAAGLRLFIGTGRCLQCHNGPLFTNNEFHNTGLLPRPGHVPDQGRTRAVTMLRVDPFNCVGAFSDAQAAQCTEFNFMRTGSELIGAMRTPSLRNLAGTEPYMHKGQMPTLAAALAHYNEAPFALIGHNEAEPLGFSSKELRQLEAFLHTLDAPLATDLQWLVAPAADSAVATSRLEEQGQAAGQQDSP
jgi:cytochrome c peroxidase